MRASIIGFYSFPFILFSMFFHFKKFEEMNSEMEESKELADNRLIELQKLQQDLQNVHQENNNMKVFLSTCFTAVIFHESVNILQNSINILCFHYSPKTLNLSYCR